MISEAPEEEEIDRRPLYERLQEQKDKKQAEYEDQHKLSKRNFASHLVVLSLVLLVNIESRYCRVHCGGIN